MNQIKLILLQIFFVNISNGEDYWVDVSFPIHSNKVSTNYPWLPHNVDPENNPVPEEYRNMPIQRLGNRQKFYEDFMEGCRAYYGENGDSCDAVERDRIAMSVRQPQSMQNYTTLGFKKIRAPSTLKALLDDHWNKNKDKKKLERWFSGNTYTNHWNSPTYMVSVEDTNLEGAGQDLKQKIWDATKDTIEEWTGMELKQTSLYGVRVYTEGAVLSPHADRLPLVSSAIVNVAQDVDEDWPIEVYGHDGKAYNVTMKPGDMVLYESHSLIHGRPFPLKGRYFANIFIHFEPTVRPLNRNINNHSSRLPPYIRNSSPEARKYMREHPEGWKQPTSPAAAAVPLHDVHLAAATGDIKKLQKIAEDDKEKLHFPDTNGWKPIHEAARGGQKDVLKMLVEHGADINEPANFGYGGSPLYLATESLGGDHPAVDYLMSLGADYVTPEL